MIFNFTEKNYFVFQRGKAACEPLRNNLHANELKKENKI